MTKNRDNPKTVAQLIEELKAFPPDMRVMVSGYEGGYVDCKSPGIIPVKLNVYEDWYYGPHASADDDDLDMEAVIISR